MNEGKIGVGSRLKTRTDADSLPHVSKNRRWFHRLEPFTATHAISSTFVARTASCGAATRLAMMNAIDSRSLPRSSAKISFASRFAIG